MRWSLLRNWIGHATLACAACGDAESEPETHGVKIQINGEDLATNGFSFPGDPTIADGWRIQFSHVLVGIANVTLSTNPDKAPSDQSQTDAVVAEASGPWLVDLATEGTEPGAGGQGKAALLTTIANQNKNGSEPFATDQRYAFGYETVVPTAAALRIGVGASAEPLVDSMVAHGYAVLYAGTATFEGGQSCQSTDASYDHSTIPTTFEFEFGFPTPARYVNCQNQDNQGVPFPGEEYQRGIAIPETADAVAQLTFHMEHPFFTDVAHDPGLFFDQFAAQLVGAPPGTKLTLDDLVGIDPIAVTDGAGRQLPWRTCDGSDLPEGARMKVATGTVTVNPGAPPAQALRDLRDFVLYVQSTQGHLNGGEGICAVQRRYPSPP